MRLGILMVIATCWLTLRFNECIQLIRPGSDGRPVCMQRAVTREELDAAMARREELLREEGFSRPQRPSVSHTVTQPVALLDPDFSSVYAD
jgi:hypothetical protein